MGRLIGGLGELGKGMAGLKGITDGPPGKGDSGGDGDGEKCGSGEGMSAFGADEDRFIAPLD